MLTKEVGILIILCLVVLNMSSSQVKAQNNSVTASPKPKFTPKDTASHRNKVYVKGIKYVHEKGVGTFAKITLKNTMKGVVDSVYFRLDGNIPKGCNKTYDIKKEVKLKPNQSVIISQLLTKDDCEVHEVKYIRAKYTLHVNFTLD